MDNHTAEQRHRNMAAVRGKDTKPEIAVRRLLHALGYRFRIQRKDLPGKPDIVLPKYRLAIFVNGCFWHRHPGCRHASVPSTNVEFWSKKFAENTARDARNYEQLRQMGWKVLIIWECEVKAMVAARTIPGLPGREYTLPEEDVLSAAEAAEE